MRATQDRRSLLDALAFLWPSLLGVGLFTLLPVLVSFGMAFTDQSWQRPGWSHFVGLRNFGGLLGVHATGGGRPWVHLGYTFSALMLAAAVPLALWANLARWNGLRLSGIFLTLAGVVVASATNAWEAPQGCLLAALALAGMGGWAWSAGKAETSPAGWGLLPGVAAFVGCAGLKLLSAPMWAAYAPTDPQFWQAAYNTAYFLLAVPVSLAGSLALALLLHEKLPLGDARQRLTGAGLCAGCGVVSAGVFALCGWGNAAMLAAALWLLAALGFAGGVAAFRAVFYLPALTSGVALMILWKALCYHALPRWLDSADTARLALLLAGIWMTLGGINLLLYLAALGSVPNDLLEAAEMDGATRWQKFSFVTWPHLAPMTFFLAATWVVGGLQGGFERARAMTLGGPAGGTATLGYDIYATGFEQGEIGRAAALSWVLFVVAAGFTAMFWRFGRRVAVGEV